MRIRALAAVALLVVLPGCAEEQEPAAQPTPTPSATAAPTPSVDEDLKSAAEQLASQQPTATAPTAEETQTFSHEEFEKVPPCGAVFPGRIPERFTGCMAGGEVHPSLVYDDCDNGKVMHVVETQGFHGFEGETARRGGQQPAMEACYPSIWGG